LDLPIAVGLLAGGLAGTVNAVLDRGEIYFDSLTMLIFLLLVGRWIQRRQQRWASDAVELLFSLTPNSARRVEGDQIQEVPLEAVRPGDIVEVRAGDSIPTDGRVSQGNSKIDQSLLTGESRAVAVGVGDAVHAGAVNLEARLRLAVEAVGDDTRVGKLMRLVEQCSQRRAPIVRLADRIAGWFVLVVLSLAAVTLLVWLWLDPARAVDNAVALLIVTCPCALGLATPLVVTVAIGRAARRRILIKGGETLESLARPGLLLLDKTGTITAGRTAVVSWSGAPQRKPLVAALESHSAHPVARALVSALAEQDQRVATDLPPTCDVRETRGAGIEGLVAGQRVVVGSPRFVRSHGVNVSVEAETALQQVVQRGDTPVLVGVDGDCGAVVGVGDPIRDDVPAAVRDLRGLGWEIKVLSGDHVDVVSAVARQIEIPDSHARGEVTPEEKLHCVESSTRTRHTVMVGDGVNDAAALAAATVGIAVHGGAEASLSAADVYLNRPGLRPIVELMNASRNTLRTIRRSLAVSVCYNTVAATLAMTGVIGPLLAAILMPISSFSVLLLAYGSKTFEDPS
jgi:Cu2+-exporting ATPase